MIKYTTQAYPEVCKTVCGMCGITLPFLDSSNQKLNLKQEISLWFVCVCVCMYGWLMEGRIWYQKCIGEQFHLKVIWLG